MNKWILLAAVIGLTGCRVSMDTAFRSQRVDPPAQLVVADDFVGMNEREDRVTLKEFLGIDPARIEWCAAFVNSVLEEVGIASTGSLMARSYERWGRSTDEPSPGDIMVFSRGSSSWQGHVGFYVATISYRGKDYWVVLGGNQDNSVTYRLYPVGYWRHIDTRTVNDQPIKLQTLRAMQWMLEGIPLEFIEDHSDR